MKSDAELKADLVEKLDSTPAISEANIEVFVDGGMVTLNGQVDTHQKRFQVKKTARRIAGIRGLQINIKPVHGVVKRSTR